MLNISVCLGPELSGIHCSRKTSSTNAEEASLLVSASVRIVVFFFFNWGGISTCRSGSFGPAGARGCCAGGACLSAAGLSPCGALGRVCPLPKNDQVTRLELCHSSRGRESTKVMENKTLIFLTSCVTSKVQLIYTRGILFINQTCSPAMHLMRIIK